MAPRTQRTQEPDNEPAQEIKVSPSAELQAWVDMIHSRIDALVLESAEHRRVIEPLILPLLRIRPEPGAEHAKVQRRHSLDEMEFALKRLSAPDPRPQDDDSPHVLRDAINEVIALRQIMQDLMQASSNVYKRGLTAIRDMTAR
jgi:hypothetical protein